MYKAKLEISKQKWDELISQLKKRGNGTNESGAFLLAKPDSNVIMDFVCYDELDPTCYDSKIIIFKTAGYRLLWQYCTANTLTVVADVHTHPHRWAGQSLADMQHPMILQKGHIAMIVPNYAQTKIKSLRGVGVYEYQGDNEWKTCVIKSKTILIK